MEDKIQKEMMTYYNERAEEYDELYRGILGRKRHVTIDPSVYRKDIARISEIISGFGDGYLIDIACGTGFWLPKYARNCSRITLIDQSEKMLKECSKTVEELGLDDLANIIHGDFLEIELDSSAFDSALAGFLLSHFSLEQEEIFFLKLKRILRPNSQIMFIDSAWNNERQKHRKKEGIQERILNDGRLFRVYKRYFEKSDIEEMFSRYGYEVKSCYVGKAIISAISESS